VFSLSILLSPNPLGFCRPTFFLCHPSCNAVAVAVVVPFNVVAVVIPFNVVAVFIPLNAVAVHSSTRRRHPLLNTPSPSLSTLSPSSSLSTPSPSLSTPQHAIDISPPSVFFSLQSSSEKRFFPLPFI
jgi:hypothetical protein